MSDLRIGLLGGFRVAVGARVVPEDAWSRRRPAAVIKLLALAPGHRLHREQVMDALWPALAPDAAAANLRKALHHARRSLDPDGAELIASVGELLSLREPVVDVDAFRAAASRAHRTGDAAAYDDAVELYGGDLLPEDLYDEWTFAHRDELKADYAALLGESASLLEARGELDRAVRAATRLVAAQPLNEDGHLQLIRLNALAGRRGEAVQRYEQLRSLLADELGAEPSAQAQRLYEDVRARQADDPELSADLWERVGRLRIAAGDTGGAVKAFTQALDTGGAADAAGRLHRQAAHAYLMQHDADSADAHLQAAEVADPDPAEQGRLLCLRANQAWERGELDFAQASAERARELAERHGEPDDLAAAQEALAIVSHFRGDWRSGLEAEIERVARDGLPPLGRVFDIHHCIGQYHLYGDGLSDGVEAYARRVLELAERDEVATAQAFAWCLLGESLLLQARWEEAAGCLEHSAELHASFGTKTGALAWQRLAEVAVCSGAPEDADAPLRRAAAIATVSPMALHLWGRIYATTALSRLEQGDPEGAARAVRSAAAAAARYGSCPSCSALLNPVAAEVFSALDDRESAAAYADSAAGVAGFFASSAWSAMAESAAASAAAAEHDEARAQTGFHSAAELYERAGQPYWVERSLAHAGGNVQGTPAS